MKPNYDKIDPRGSAGLAHSDEPRPGQTSSFSQKDSGDLFNHNIENRDELVVNKHGNDVYQAGSNGISGPTIAAIRKKAENSLFFFTKVILNRYFLAPFHKDVCEFVQKCPPHRKLVIMPRGHAKSLIGARSFPLHAIIQPKGGIYFPEFEGSEMRIMVAGETKPMAQSNLQVLEAEASENQLLRALWPHRFWTNARRESKMWNADGLIFPRQNNWPNPTIWAAGVGTAVTGSRPTIIVKDDLISDSARNSATEMETAIQWHRDTRALFDKYDAETGQEGIEIILGTRWAVHDLYSYIEDNDPSVEILPRKYWQIIRNDEILWKSRFKPEDIEELRHEHGFMFYFHYMNNPADSQLVDFDLDNIRECKLVDNKIIFNINNMDTLIANKIYDKSDNLPPAPTQNLRGRRMTPDIMRDMAARREGILLSRS